jgi:hypothetical protein
VLGCLCGVAGGVATARASDLELHVLYQNRATRLLTPGTPFVAIARGSLAAPGRYCLGLTSMRDRYGIPVSVGTFRPLGSGVMVAQALVPTRVFPAEPPGAFLLFVGRCTDVAPDGIYGAITVTIMPAAG